MSRSYQEFENGVRDAEELLVFFDEQNKKAPSTTKNEVLKRAGLVMALTAWETYVEDRLREEMEDRLNFVSGSALGDFVKRKLEQDLKTFHNPNSEKTRRIFREYLGIDIAEGWTLQHLDSKKASAMLDDWIAKRGEAVHRSRPTSTGVPSAHLVKRDELEKVIRFVKELAKVTDSFLEKKRS